MKEVTMITTCEITTIVMVSDEAATYMETYKDDIANELRDVIKSEVAADDVNILKKQIFIRDVPN